jgi:hypothetical protein
LSFGGGGGGSGSITAHKHNSQSGEGGPLQFRDSITLGTSVQVNGGTEIPLENNINLRSIIFG